MDYEDVRNWVENGCPEGVSGMPENVQALLDTIADLRARNEALREAPTKMLKALRKAEEILRKSGMACSDKQCAYCASAEEIRTILAANREG